MPRPTGPSGSKTSNHETNGETNGTVNDDDDDIIMGDLTHPLNDPEQNPVERRMIRSNYRDIISSLNENEHDLTNPGTSNLHQELDRVEGVFRNVKYTREAVLDSQAISRIAELGCRKAQALHTDILQFDAADFSKRVLNFLSGSESGTQPEDDSEEQGAVSAAGWEQLGKAVQAFFQRSPPLSLMYGTFEHGPPKKKARNPRKPVDDDKDQKEIKVKASSELSKKETTTDEVENIHSLLRHHYEEWQGSAICYFEFVVNPHSFGQTIENMFYVSFLVKDGHAKVYLDEDNLPVIEPMRREAAGQPSQSAQSDSKQVVMSMTMQDWKDIVKVFQIEEPLIPTRDNI